MVVWEGSRVTGPLSRLRWFGKTVRVGLHFTATRLRKPTAQSSQSFARFPSKNATHRGMEQPSKPCRPSGEIVFVFDRRRAITQIMMPNSRGKRFKEGRAVQHLYSSNMRSVEGDVFGFQCDAAEVPATSTDRSRVQSSLSQIVAEASILQQRVPLQSAVVIVKKAKHFSTGCRNGCGYGAMRH